VIIMDIDLKERRMGGVEAARIISQTYTPAIIYVTGHPTDEFLNQVNLTPQMALLRKPWDELTLLDNVKLALARMTHLPTIFISYARDQAFHKRQLVAHLRVLEGAGVARVWDDEQLTAGERWEGAILGQIANCAVAVLLISREFLAPDKFVIKRELPEIINRNKSEGMRIIPVIARPCDWMANKTLSALNAWSGGRVIWPNGNETPDADLVELTQQIRKLVQRQTA
jgi:CheY-like chemotaxis protein